MSFCPRIQNIPHMTVFASAYLVRFLAINGILVVPLLLGDDPIAEFGAISDVLLADNLEGPARRANGREVTRAPRVAKVVLPVNVDDLEVVRKVRTEVGAASDAVRLPVEALVLLGGAGPGGRAAGQEVAVGHGTRLLLSVGFARGDGTSCCHEGSNCCNELHLERDLSFELGKIYGAITFFVPSR